MIISCLVLDAQAYLQARADFLGAVAYRNCYRPDAVAVGQRCHLHDGGAVQVDSHRRMVAVMVLAVGFGACDGRPHAIANNCLHCFISCAQTLACDAPQRGRGLCAPLEVQSSPLALLDSLDNASRLARAASRWYSFQLSWASRAWARLTVGDPEVRASAPFD